MAAVPLVLRGAHYAANLDLSGYLVTGRLIATLIMSLLAIVFIGITYFNQSLPEYSARPAATGPISSRSGEESADLYCCQLWPDWHLLARYDPPLGAPRPWYP